MLSRVVLPWLRLIGIDYATFAFDLSIFALAKRVTRRFPAFQLRVCLQLGRRALAKLAPIFRLKFSLGFGTSSGGR